MGRDLDGERVRGNKLYGGVSSYLPLKVNQAGMIPLIFAVSVLLFPQFIAQAAAIFSPSLSLQLNTWVTNFLNNQLYYGILYFLLVFLFTFLYTAITFNPEEIAKNLQRSGGFLPGVHQGVPFRGQGDPILHVANPQGIDTKPQPDTLDLIGELNAQQQTRTMRSPPLDGSNEHDRQWRSCAGGSPCGAPG